MTSSMRKRHGLGAWITAAALLVAVPTAVASPVGNPASAKPPAVPGADHAAHPVPGTPGTTGTTDTTDTTGKPDTTGKTSKPGTPQTPPAPTPACSPAAVSQPFAAFGDFHYYTLAPGQAPGDFNGAGWTLKGGAKIVTTTLKDGTRGSVLDLPAGSQAVSPTMCLTNLDPTARAMVQNLVGSAGVDIKVTYLTRHGHTVSTGNIKGRNHAWALSRTVHIHPSHTSGWQLAQFTLVPRAKKKSDDRIYDFYVDPRMVH